MGTEMLDPIFEFMNVSLEGWHDSNPNFLSHWFNYIVSNVIKGTCWILELNIST